MTRIDGRANDELRLVQITPSYHSFAEGSALMELGQTRVLCTVSVEDRIPAFIKDMRQGWITAEYAMLPRSTHTRTPRNVGDGRIQEIRRVISRSLRAITDLPLLGERTLIVDCDVLQADGGTRTAAITGSYVALVEAVDRLVRMGVLGESPLKSAIAATSVGIVDGEALLDLCYEEDSRAEVDFNVVMTAEGQFVEVQGTAEATPFDRGTIDQLLALAERGIRQLLEIQQRAVESFKV